jgi:hypothetical protein
MFLKQNTAATICFGPFLDKTNGVTEINTIMAGGAGTGLDHATTGIKLSKNGGALAVRSGFTTTPTPGVQGLYLVNLSATDTNTVGALRIVFSDNGGTILPVWQDYMVLPATTYDALVTGGANALPVDLVKWNGAAVIAPTTAGTPDVNVLRISNDAVAADNAELFFDGTGYAGTNNVIPIVSTVNALASGSITAAAIADNAIDRATFAADTGLQSIRSATALAGGSSTVDLDAGASSVAEFYTDCWIYLTSGTGAGQARRILSYDGTFKIVNVAPVWATNPANGTGFAILPHGRVDIGSWKGITPNDLVSSRIDASVGAMATDVLTNTALASSAVTEIQAGLATSAALATVQADTDDIQTRLPAALIGGRMDSDVEAINNSTEAADDLQFSAATIVRGTASGTPTTTTMPASDLPSAVNDHYNGRIIIWTSGVLADQATNITDYDGATKTLTFTAITSAPAAATTFVII